MREVTLAKTMVLICLCLQLVGSSERTKTKDQITAETFEIKLAELKSKKCEKEEMEKMIMDIGSQTQIAKSYQEYFIKNPDKILSEGMETADISVLVNKIKKINLEKKNAYVAANLITIIRITCDPEINFALAPNYFIFTSEKKIIDFF